MGYEQQAEKQPVQCLRPGTNAAALAALVRVSAVLETTCQGPGPGFL